ncbi:MBL fold metallo-hydrolase [bacterium]|nr:MBL fold metallo-hydrolase [bacterium]
MKILNLTENSTTYTSNVYFVLGDHNALADMNTLVDVGRDPAAIQMINDTWTGAGKKRVAQVVLTHNHYDHTGLLTQVCEAFRPTVYAWDPLSLQDKRCPVNPSSQDGKCPRKQKLYDKDVLKMGDRTFEVIHSPGHTGDSVCLYCEEDGVLFVGDTPVIIRYSGSYESGFISALKDIARRKIKSIYFGHGKPLLKGCNEAIKRSLKIALSSHK